VLGEVLTLLDLRDPQIQIHRRGGGQPGGRGGDLGRRRWGARWGEGEARPWLLAPPRSRPGAGGERGTRSRARGGDRRRGCDLRLAFWAAWLECEGKSKSVGWLAHSLVLATARDDGVGWETRQQTPLSSLQFCFEVSGTNYLLINLRFDRFPVKTCKTSETTNAYLF
jgi:hypothetical protein